MDQCTRRIVGFGVHRDAVDGVGLCRMFNGATRGHTPPTYLSSDHDRLYQSHQWQANLRILDVEEIKTVPYAPLSHPFVERLIGTIRRECLDRTLFWTASDLEMKLLELLDIPGLYIFCGYHIMIPMKAILLKLPNELVEAGDTCAESLGVTRAEYIRRAIDRMNHETARAQRARDLMTASKKVRAESARVNAEFDVIEGDVET